jgi:xanthine dehydrogenase accessory factor
VDEALFAQLAAKLADEAIVLASVRNTRGATPRKSGSRMLIAAAWTHGSVGGGAAEARVIEAARECLRDARAEASVDIDLTGRPGAAGVCGGAMQVALRRWQGEVDRQRARSIAASLSEGRCITLTAADIGGAGTEDEIARPDARLLIVGGGHCALALYDLARFLDFDIWVFDEREACFAQGQFAGATQLPRDYNAFSQAFASEREVYAVLLNRDYASDVATLRALAGRPLAFLGMMGSRKRIAEVRAAVADLPSGALEKLVAPIGLELDAQTPHEIAVSILAQLVQVRRRRESGSI